TPRGRDPGGRCRGRRGGGRRRDGARRRGRARRGAARAGPARSSSLLPCRVLVRDRRVLVRERRRATDGGGDALVDGAGRRGRGRRRGRAVGRLRHAHDADRRGLEQRLLGRWVPVGEGQLVGG